MSESLSYSSHHNIIATINTPDAGIRDRREAMNRHSTDVKPRDLTSLDLDLRQMGVGGDDSWGAQTHDQYRLLDATYSYSFRLRPFDASQENPADLARQSVSHR